MSESNAVRSLITPQDQTLREVFHAQRSYQIDIYQREYKWTEANVEALLNDIEVRFGLHERKRTDPKEIHADVKAHFEPYFLNTYLTHTTPENTSIVDGQQRLTTFLLIFIKLYRILQEVETLPGGPHKTFTKTMLGQLIFETNDFGEAARFKIYNENREGAFRALIEGSTKEARDETGRRIGANYATISSYFDGFLKSADGAWDLVKVTYYIGYLLDRISIVEIHIERQDNVAMIFEVVNDRGLGLKPYEILKGKLIGSLPGPSKEKANRIWTDLQEKYARTELKNTDEKTIDLDVFFRVFFRAKFADSDTEYAKFEGDYHYEMYRNAKVRAFFGDFQNRELLFRRLTEEVNYFADLYLRLRAGYDDEFVFYNKLLDQNQQYLILLSVLRRDDPQESLKINIVARKFDQVHVILRLLDVYDSGDFQRLIYRLVAKVREQEVGSAIAAFDEELLASLVDAGVVLPGQCSEARDVFEFERFKGVRHRWPNFSKYVLTRIDRHLARHLDKPSYASAPLPELENRFNRTGRKTSAMHLEHIYTQHPPKPGTVREGRSGR